MAIICCVTESDDDPLEQRYETILKAGALSPAFTVMLGDGTEFTSPRYFMGAHRGGVFLKKSPTVLFFRTKIAIFVLKKRTLWISCI